jgi:hypothetical protein
MPLLILALGLFLVEIFPFSMLALGGSWFRFMRYVGVFVSLFVMYALPFVAAWLILRWLRIKPYVAQLTQGRHLMQIGLAVFGLYLFLAAGGKILSAIPYGGGHVPQALGWVALAAKLPLFAGLALAIGKEFPQAWVAAQLRAIQARAASAKPVASAPSLSPGFAPP